MDAICHNLLLADDDIDDCILFKEALEDIDLNSSLTTVSDGRELMQYLFNNQHALPDVLFLDLNMPRKTGYECLSEIRENKVFQDLPIVIFSTSFDPQIVNLLFEKGAHYYIRKPADFLELKKLIYKAITSSCDEKKHPQLKEHFVLST
ncbi:MAG TPA: response regulator [Saprospiraceae bacterium]|nr:response regulator [Saprospiraceae bacterium]